METESKEVKSYIIYDIVVIELKDVLTPKEIIRNLLNLEVVPFYVDISTKVNEDSTIFTLSENVEPKFKEKRGD